MFIIIFLDFLLGSSSGVTNNDAISEEAVRRYLKRRPMTTTDLLKKFRLASGGEYMIFYVGWCAEFLVPLIRGSEMGGGGYLMVR